MNGGVVFILGAGASASAGAPVMQNFFQKAKRLRRRRRLADYEGDFDAVNHARSILRRTKVKSRLDIENLEEIYTALEMVENIDGIDGLTANQAKAAQRSLDNLIAITLEQSIQFPIEKTSNNHLRIVPTTAYQRLAAEAIRSNGINTSYPITFITFNYDIAFDFALFSEKVKFTYCFDGKIDNRLIRYCKLHGSLHWALNSKTGKLINAYLDFSELENSRSDLLEAKHICIRVDKKFWKKNVENVSSHPFIVPPTGNKPYLQSKLKPVWKAAAASLREAEVIVVIGYSFPKTDQFFRNFFALSTMGPADLEKILIVDPNERAYQELTSLVNPDLHSNIVYLQKAFDESHDEIADLLGDYLNNW